MQKDIKVLSIGAVITAMISSMIGVFYTYGGTPRTVQNIYGQDVVLYGDGVYANNSLMKVGATKGTDIVVLLVCFLLLATIFLLSNKSYARLIHTGLLSCLVYASTYLVMGVNFNRLFPLYLVQFSCSLFAFIVSLSNLIHSDCFDDSVYEKKMKGTGIFLIISGCSVLIWLIFIIPAVISGVPTNFIEIYTTEPTYAVDLGVILPSFVFCGISLIRKKKIAHPLASVLLVLVTCVGLCVIAQTAIQLNLGISINAGQMIGMVMSFVVLGAIAIILNMKLCRYARVDK